MYQIYIKQAILYTTYFLHSFAHVVTFAKHFPVIKSVAVF